MIRAWLAHARAERVAARAARGERAWRRDLHEHPDERDQFRLAQIAGLRESLAEANQRLAEEKAARVREVAQLRAALAPYLAQEWARRGAAAARRLATEPTHHVPQRAPGWSGTETERRPR